MKVKELILALEACNPEDDVVVQTNHGDGYFSHHKLLLQLTGHPGHLGPIFHVGEQVDIPEKKAEEKYPHISKDIYPKHSEPSDIVGLHAIGDLSNSRDPRGRPWSYVIQPGNEGTCNCSICRGNK